MRTISPAVAPVNIPPIPGVEGTTCNFAPIGSEPIPIPVSPVALTMNGVPSATTSSTTRAFPSPIWVMRTISLEVLPENKPAIPLTLGSTCSFALALSVPIPVSPDASTITGVESGLAESSIVNALPEPNWVIRTISSEVVPVNRPAILVDSGTTSSFAAGNVSPIPTSPETYMPLVVVAEPTCSGCRGVPVD